MMARIRQKSEKKGIVMTLLTLLLIGTACNDQTDNPTINPSVGEMVEVSLNIGFAHETDASTLLAANTTKSTASSSGNEPLSVQLVPATRSAEATTARPDQFYNLEIYQYDANGSYLANTIIGTVAEGPITASLNNSTAQLLIIARGETPAISSFANKSLSDVRKLTASANTIKTIGVEDGTNINNMPYLLYLPEVKIENNTLVSPEGVDVRLLLKRLAVGLKLDWTISQNMLDQGYVLKEARLMQVPADYRILPERETEVPYGEMYPTGISEFIDGFRLKGDALTNAYGSATLWLPANARGTRRDINVPNQKSKRRAHSSATYIEFVVDNSKNQERLFYRVYLGANMTTDFNLLENTNYHWTIKIETPSYTTDERVQLLDQTPVISANEQPTANCFMMRPGTNICFNPYKHEAGEGGWNTQLVSDGTIQHGKEIKKMKVLWQNKDKGTSGDLVMGYAISESDHRNLVNLTDGDNINKARIHVKVPMTSGGNAVIAAYGDNETEALWSWHIWISDYVPVGLKDFTAGNTVARWAAIKAAKAATKGGTVHTYDAEDYSVSAWTDVDGAFHKSVVMDRNLGATRGVYSLSSLDAARTFGNIYEWGRKDPFLGSVDGTSVEINFCYDEDGMSIPIKKEQWSKGSSATNDARLYAIAHPGIYLTSPNTSKAVQFPSDSWNSTSKTLYDPCPKGWKVPDFSNADDKKNMYKTFQSRNNKGALEYLIAGEWKTGTTSKLTASQFMVTNGFLYYPKTGSNTTAEERNSDKAVWFPAIRLREYNSGSLREPFGSNGSFNSDWAPAFLFWGVGKNGSGYNRGVNVETKIAGSGSIGYGSNYHSYGWSIRCVQE